MDHVYIAMIMHTHITEEQLIQEVRDTKSQFIRPWALYQDIWRMPAKINYWTIIHGLASASQPPSVFGQQVYKDKFCQKMRYKIGNTRNKRLLQNPGLISIDISSTPTGTNLKAVPWVMNRNDQNMKKG